MSSYLLYESKGALRAFTFALELKFPIFDPRGKIVQNVNFLSISQNSDLSLNVNPSRQHEYRGILGFQNRALNIKLLNFHTNQDNSAYIKKCNFEQKAHLAILRLSLDSWCRNEFESDLGS